MNNYLSRFKKPCETTKCTINGCDLSAFTVCVVLFSPGKHESRRLLLKYAYFFAIMQKCYKITLDLNSKQIPGNHVPPRITPSTEDAEMERYTGKLTAGTQTGRETDKDTHTHTYRLPNKCTK